MVNTEGNTRNYPLKEVRLHGNELLFSCADEMEDGRFGDVILKFGRSRTHWVNEASLG